MFAHVTVFFIIAGNLFSVCVATAISNRTSPTENGHLNLFQGDIYLRDPRLLGDFHGRSAVAQEWLKWPDGTVYYELDQTFSDEDKNVIKSAMDEFHQLTCIQWKERQNDEENFVEIENNVGCWSEAGMQGGPQVLTLESPRCMKKGVVMHELMHTLGFLHEISRHDRDDYVTIHYDNVIRGYEENFVKLSPFQLNDLGLKYDYRSVMHYKAWAFASDKSKPTVTPTDDSVQLSELGTGEREGEFTETDVQKVKKFYQCSD